MHHHRPPRRRGLNRRITPALTDREAAELHGAAELVLLAAAGGLGARERLPGLRRQALVRARDKLQAAMDVAADHTALLPHEPPETTGTSANMTDD